jgi:mannose-6-phosphate isomerase-like protein (cupin superfamily)
VLTGGLARVDARARYVPIASGSALPGAHVRYLMDGQHGNMIHSTVPPGMVGRACRFRTIDEYWFVLSGEGEIWRRGADSHEGITRLLPGVCTDIPLGTAFQYRCTRDVPPRVHLHGPAALAGGRRGGDHGWAVGTKCGPAPRGLTTRTGLSGPRCTEGRTELPIRAGVAAGRQCPPPPQPA